MRTNDSKGLIRASRSADRSSKIFSQKRQKTKLIFLVKAPIRSNIGNGLHQKYNRQKVVDRISSGNDSLATRLLQLTVLWTTCLYYTEITAYNELSMLSHF